MTKRKVIEDSDDEENREASPQRPSATGLSDITLSTLVTLDSSSSHEIPDQNADPSTSSTELLNRESHAAHKSLIEPTPKSIVDAISTNSSSQPTSSTSPTASRFKTKRSKTSVEKPKAKRQLKTYGRSSQDIFEFRGGSDGELDTRPRKDLVHKAGKFKKNGNPLVDHKAGGRGSQEGVTRRPITSSGGDTDPLSIEPKIREGSSAGEKEVSLRSSMPPPASKSTTFDQSQRSQSDTIPTIAESRFLNSAASSVIPPADAIYPGNHSDDQTSAPRRPSGGELDEEGCSDLAQSIKLPSKHTGEATKIIDLRPTEEPAPSSSASEISPSRIITVKRTNQTKIVAEGLSSRLDSEHLDSQLEHNTSAIVNPVVLLPAPTDIEEAQDELSLSIHEAASKSPTKVAKAPKRKRDTDDEPFDELGSDRDATGVPKERYHPRPSKRRSGAGDGEVVVPTDFSKRPEAIGKGKRKTKRHKTTAFQELLPKDEDEDEDEEVKVIPDPRFEIPEKKLKTSAEGYHPDLERHDGTEDIHLEAQPESNQAVKAKKRGRPKKVVTNLSEETVVDEPENGQDHDDVILPTAKKPRKRTKTKETPTPIIDDQDGITDGTFVVEDDPEDLPANALHETHGNISPSKPASKPIPENSSVKATAAAPETPRKATTPALKGLDKHSPISSGKVAYRVGLSKRARIAPLLRIVRK